MGRLTLKIKSLDPSKRRAVLTGRHSFISQETQNFLLSISMFLKPPRQAVTSYETQATLVARDLKYGSLVVEQETFLCGNKMPTRCNRGFYCRSYCLLNMFRVPLCPSSGAQEYYTVVAACGISCCKNVKSNLYVRWNLCSQYCRVLSRFVIRCVECHGGRVWVFLVCFL